MHCCLWDLAHSIVNSCCQCDKTPDNLQDEWQLWVGTLCVCVSCSERSMRRRIDPWTAWLPNSGKSSAGQHHAKKIALLMRLRSEWRLKLQKDTASEVWGWLQSRSSGKDFPEAVLVHSVYNVSKFLNCCGCWSEEKTRLVFLNLWNQSGHNTYVWQETPAPSEE